ncbi:secreted protein [Cryptosporidium xiaoi]|uniref:Secreted protein n=1 Tax=Cryptosporidium xiaoi TaxID=659607 RepID=A0AAV9XX78_9CRYT
MRFSILIILLLGLIIEIKTQDIILESEEGQKNADDNGVSDSNSSGLSENPAKTPNFILLCALIPQIPGCPCDPLLETRPTFYDFVSSDCSCYDSQQSGFSSSPCFCSKPDSDECKCLSGLSSLDEEHDRMCIVSPLTYVTPYANCTSFLNPLGEHGLCSGDSELSEHCITLKSCRRLTPIPIEEESVQEKCAIEPEMEGCPCSQDQLVTDEDALICSCYRNLNNPGCPCDIEPESTICKKFKTLVSNSSTSSTTTVTPSTKSSNIHTNETTSSIEPKAAKNTNTTSDKDTKHISEEEDDIVPHNSTLMKDVEPGTDSTVDKNSSANSPLNVYFGVLLTTILVFLLK